MEMNRIWKELQDSAKEFATVGLHASAKALDFTVGKIQTLKEEVDKTAERLQKKDDEPSRTETM